jgi:uncharacterized membrane protein
VNRVPGLLRFVALCAVIIAAARSIVAPSALDATGVLSVLIAGTALVWVADVWELRRERRRGAAAATAGRVTRELAQPALIGVLVWVLATDPPMWRSVLAGALALATPAAALALVRLARSGTAPADG